MSRTGAVLLAVLAALVHILICAHGPTSGETGQADSLPLAASPAASTSTPGRPQQAEPLGIASPQGHDGASCEGLDEPTVQSSRDAVPAGPTAHDVPAIDLLTARPSLTPAALTSLPSADGPTSGHTRARLGVWRT
ncbi:hypothetical protein [Streptomyces scabiei]|uniref:hypothetical protein n=1 Tax=Streptomyces scabiei TaxID=1930 RepID=UPI0029B8540F|nr:hypothetical protein [Streptomyces scabiei]MDX3522000.1 hypothetical protein [Streptomyces scabiei]